MVSVLGTSFAFAPCSATVSTLWLPGELVDLAAAAVFCRACLLAVILACEPAVLTPTNGETGVTCNLLNCILGGVENFCFPLPLGLGSLKLFGTGVGVEIDFQVRYLDCLGHAHQQIQSMSHLD